MYLDVYVMFIFRSMSINEKGEHVQYLQHVYRILLPHPLPLNNDLPLQRVSEL